MATGVLGSWCSRFSTDVDCVPALGTCTRPRFTLNLQRCFYQPYFQTRRARLVVCCADQDASETPKPRRKKKDDGTEQPKVKKRQPKASLDSGEPPTEKKKRVTKSRKKKEEENTETENKEKETTTGKRKKKTKAVENVEEEVAKVELLNMEEEVEESKEDDDDEATSDSEEEPKVKKRESKRVTTSRRKKPEEETSTGKRKKKTTKTVLRKVKEDSPYDKEERWKLMKEESFHVVKGTLLDREADFESDEEEEEEDEDEEDEEDEAVQVEVVETNKSDMKHFVDMKFPDKDCYALISSYKPRKIDKTQPPALKNEELWWNHREPDPKDHFWSEFQKRPGLPDITKAAMAAMTGQIKLFGDTPSVTETYLHRARKFVLYEERLAAEEKRRNEIGPMAYYQEWVKAWDKDTSNEAVQKHYEETGEDVSMQLMNMLACQTREEYRHMMGTDVRIKRDPLEMRATREMKRSVFGGDPVYPTVNYIKKPGATVDYRGPNFHQPQPSVIEYLIKCGTMKTREEHNRIMALQEERLAAEAAMYGEEDDEEPAEEMAAAIDIGDKDLEDEEEDEEEVEFKDGEEVIVVPREKLLELPDEDEGNA